MLRIKDFGGGLNLRANPSAMPANQSPDCLNFMINTDGSLTKRKGYTLAYEGPGGPLNGAYLFNRSGSIHPLMSTATGIYDNATQISTVACATRRFYNEFNDACLITSASHDPLIYNGSGLAEPLQFKDENGVNKSPIRMVETKTHTQRVWGYGPSSSNLFYSEIGYYDRWNGNNIIAVEPYDGGFITHIEEIFDTLVIYKNNGTIWILRGSTNADFTLSKVVDSKTIAGPMAISSVDNVHFFLDQSEGVFAFDGVNFRNVSDNINPELKVEANSGATMIYLDGYLWLTSGTKTYCMDTRTGAWTRHTIPVKQYLKRGNDIVFDAGDGNLYKFDGYNDNGVEIKAHYYTPYFDVGSPGVVKQYLKIKPEIFVNGNTVTLEYNLDKGEASGSIQFQRSNTADRWGSMKWGVGKWYSPPRPLTQNRPISMPTSTYGVDIQVCFREGGDLRGGNIVGAVFEFRPKRSAF